MGTCSIRGVTAFHPSDQTCSAIANSVLTTLSSSTPVATREMGPHIDDALDDEDDDDTPV
jgi:hypothetical protein